MKKLMMILMAVPICAFAGTDDTNEICRRNTLVMAVLQMGEQGNGTKYEQIYPDDNTQYKVHLPYDIFGDMRSNVKAEYINVSSTCNEIFARSAADGSSSDDGTTPVPGDVNSFLKAAPGDIGTRCWCRMSGPVTSWWMYAKTYSDSDTCGAQCGKYCASGFMNNSALDNGRGMRDAMFYAIW